METVDEKLAEIGSLYIDYCEAFGTWKFSFKIINGFVSIKFNRLLEARQLRQKILSKIDNLIETASNVERDRYALIKSIILNSATEEVTLVRSSQSKLIKAREMLNESISLLSPLMDDETKHPMALHAFIEATYLLGVTLNKLTGIHQEALDCYLRNQELYLTFLKSYKLEDVWDFKKIFGIDDEGAEQLSDVVKDYQEQRSLKEHISVTFFKLALSYRDQRELYIKYGLQAMSVFHGQLLWDSESKRSALYILTNLVECLIAANRLKQANYLLGVTVYHSVKIVREPCLPDDKIEFKNLQGTLSRMFAILGETIIKLSLLHRNEQDSRNEIEKIFTSNEAEVVVGTELMEEGAEKYVTQYPIKMLESDKEIKSVGKKALKWIQRAETLITMFEDERESISITKQSLNQMLKSIEKN